MTVGAAVTVTGCASGCAMAQRLQSEVAQLDERQVAHRVIVESQSVQFMEEVSTRRRAMDIPRIG